MAVMQELRNFLIQGLVLLLCLVFFLGAELLAKAGEETPSYVMCRNSKMIRTIRVEQNAEKGKCETVYTKSGVDRSVASGIHLSSCQQFVENIRRNLEVASWKCRDISAKASISDSSNTSHVSVE